MVIAFAQVNGWDVLKMKIRPPAARNAVSEALGGSGGPFSKSARRGAPPVISVNVRRPTYFSGKVAHPPGAAGFLRFRLSYWKDVV